MMRKCEWKRNLLPILILTYSLLASSTDRKAVRLRITTVLSTGPTASAAAFLRAKSFPSISSWRYGRRRARRTHRMER